MRTLLLALILAAAAFAADIDISGRCSGSMTLPAADGQSRDGGALFVLKQAGSTITGTAGPSEDHQMAISNGKLDGSKLTFSVQNEGLDVSFTITVDGSRMTGEASGTVNGQQMKVTPDLSQAK